MKHKDIRLGIRIIGFILLTVYLIVLGYLVFFSKEFGRDGTTSLAYNLEPFHTISNYLKHREAITFKSFLVNMIGNIVAFLPFGTILPMVFKASTTKYYFHIVVFWTFILSLSIETLQILFKVGVFDVDDLILNTLGGFVGYLVYLMIRSGYRKAMKRRKRRGN